MTTFKIKNRFADRGKVAETQVQRYLEQWVLKTPCRDYSRLVDSKAAGRIIKAAAADFEFYCLEGGEHYSGLIEVKETKHAYRLEKSRLTQFARLRKRWNCGSHCYVLVYHSQEDRWRCMTPHWLGFSADGASWDLRQKPIHPTAESALWNEGFPG